MPASPFGILLKERRRAQDLTQERLSELVGCAVVTLKKIESGALRPSRQICARLAEALAIPQDERAAFIALARGGADTPVSPEATPIVPPADQASDRLMRGYALREQIGVGGFGVVYRAYQPVVGRDVAIKVIAPAYADQPAFIRRFEVEAQTVARLEHPHIVPLYDYWREPGSAYLVMRWMRGGSLVDGLRHGPWTAAAVTPVIEQIGAALATAHRAGIVHRDVKPANVLLDSDGNAYLADFGIAKGIDVTHNTTTVTGAIVGSPDYLSPEQLRNEPISPQTDIYSLGVLLYELLTGSNPFAGLSPAERLQRQLHEPLPDLRTHRPELVALNTVLRRATAKLPSARHPDVERLITDVIDILTPARQWKAIGNSQTTIAAPEDVRDAAAAPASSPRTLANPYKGLRSFQEADADQFFGRDALTQRLLERLAPAEPDRFSMSAGARFLAVVGPSGSGKSSVAKAGLLPALRRGDLAATEHWFIAELLPGPHPLEEIEAALLRVAVNPPPSLLEQLREDERGLTRAVKRSLPADERVVLVLVIDQFEEVFTLVEREEERLHLLRSLLVAATDPRGRLVLIIILRADFYDRPLRFPGFSELIRTGTEVVTPLTSAELESAIIQPATRVNVTVEPALVATIARDVEAQPGALPLVQYALTELFERRDGRTMTLDAYRSIGGIASAVARRADALYEDLDDDGRGAARQVFLRLVTIGEGVEDTRRRVRLSELNTLDAERVLESYGRYRLLTFDRDPLTGEPTVEVSHEALIRVWARLRGWLDDSRSDLIAHRRLVVAAAEWAQSGADPSFLAAGARLAQFEGLATSGDVVLNDDEQDYLDASRAERERLVELDRAREALLRENLARSEAQRLAAEANRLLQAGGNAELIALLAINSIRMRYTPQGDEALAGAAMLTYPLQMYNSRGINLAISPDGASVIFAGFDIRASMYDIETGNLLHIFKGAHTDRIFNVRISPDGVYLATCSADGLIQLWNCATEERLGTCIGHNQGIMGLAFTSNGERLVTGGDDGTIRQWEVPTGRELHCFAVHDRVENMALTSSGDIVATVGMITNSAHLWNLHTGSPLLSLTGHNGGIWCIGFSPDGQLIATGGADYTVRLWNAQTGTELHCLTGHTDPVLRVVFSPDGSLLASCGDDGTTRLWDVATHREVQCCVGHTAFAFATAFTPDGRRLITVSSDGSARLWPVLPQPYLPTFPGLRARFSPDGRTLATGHLDGIARLWDADTGNLIQIFSRHEVEIPSVAFTPDGRRLLTGGGDGMPSVWDIATGRKLFVLHGHTTNVRILIASDDSRFLLTCSDDNTARIWDATTGTLIHVLSGHSNQVFDAAFAPDSRIVVTGSTDGTIRLWDTTSGAELLILSAPGSSVAFTPDSSTLITADWSGIIRMWDVASGTQIDSWLGHFTTIWTLRVSPLGRYLLSGSSDRTARLWDIQTRRELRRFAGHTSGIFSVDFSPDERYVLTGSNDGTARLWDIDYATTISYLQSRLLSDLTINERAQYGIASEA